VCFGHPKGLFPPAFTEARERFSFYGMTALLVLYMVDQLLLPGHVEKIAGFAAFRVDALVSILAVPVLFRLWRLQATHRGESGEIAKIGIGAWIAAASQLILVAAIVSAKGASIHPIFPTLCAVGMGVAFLYYGPTLLALVSPAAPVSVNATMMGIASTVGLLVLPFGRRLRRALDTSSPQPMRPSAMTLEVKS